MPGKREVCSCGAWRQTGQGERIKETEGDRNRETMRTGKQGKRDRKDRERDRGRKTERTGRETGKRRQRGQGNRQGQDDGKDRERKTGAGRH